MKFLTTIVFLFAFALAGAQDCRELVRVDEETVFPETDNNELAYDLGGIFGHSYSDLLTQGKSKRKILVGHQFRTRSVFQRGEEWGEPDSFEIRVVRDSSKIYLTASHTSPIGCRLVFGKRYYVITFTDSSAYTYNEPFHTDHAADDIFILLKGPVTTKRMESGWLINWEHADGDTPLFSKMLTTPIYSIQPYEALDWSETRPPQGFGKLLGDFEADEKRVLPLAAGIRLMHSLQCLVKVRY